MDFAATKSPPEPRSVLLIPSARAPRWLVSCTGTVSEDVCRSITRLGWAQIDSALFKFYVVGSEGSSSRCRSWGAIVEFLRAL